jgi:hypothetical protein
LSPEPTAKVEESPGGQKTDPAKMRALRLRLSERAKSLSPEEKMEQMWAHGSERRPNPYVTGQRKLVGYSARKPVRD